MLLSQGWCQYQFDKRLEGYSPRTLKAYLIQSNLLIRYFGDIEMDSLQAEDLKQYLVKDADRLKPTSLGHRICFVKSLFRWDMKKVRQLVSMFN